MAYGQMVYIPWGYTETPPPNSNALHTLAKKVKRKFPYNYLTVFIHFKLFRHLYESVLF